MYLPRLQGGLTGISPAPADAATYVLTQADNTIRLVRGLPGHPRLLPLKLLWPPLACELAVVGCGFSSARPGGSRQQPCEAGIMNRTCAGKRLPLQCLQVNVAMMRVLCSVHGLRPRVEGVSGTVAALVPGSGQLALAGPGSVVQLFDALRDRHVDRVQVWDTRRLPPTPVQMDPPSAVCAALCDACSTSGIAHCSP